MSSVVQQTVHGYSRGHIELTASIKLDRGDVELLTRLSDLSGALSQEREFTPYLTFYPLPSQSYYAVAQTWLDEEAPRAGCVLTHTILIPMERWATSKCLYSYATLLRKPTRDALATFSVPVAWVSSADPLPDVSGRVVAEFASRFFGEGLQPLVWFGENAAGIIAWRLVEAIWPRLRRRFSCCTFALKPRFLDDRPFDVLFAPEDASSRFTEYAREHVIQPTATVTLPNEGWLTRWTSCVFSNPRTEDERDVQIRVRALSQGIEAYPTAIRRVFLYLELCERADRVPVAAVGALDALGTLGLALDLVAAEAIRLVRTTLESVDTVPSEDKIELLYLFAERVAVVHDGGLDSLIRSMVANLIALADNDVLRKAEDLAGRHPDGSPDAFLLGVADAIPRRLELQPSDVSLFFKLSTLGRILVGRIPEIAYALLRAGRNIGLPETTNILVEWCSRAAMGESRAALRMRLLPFLIPTEISLARELLRDVGSEEVRDLGEAIEHGPSAMASEMAWTYAEILCGLEMTDVRSWAQRPEVNSYFSAFVVALGLPNDEASFDRVVSQVVGQKKAVLVVAVVDRLTKHVPPMWLEGRLNGDGALWSLMLADPADVYVGSALERVCGRIRRSAIARMAGVPSRLTELSPVIQDYALRQWALDWIMEGCETSTLKAWFTEPWVVTRLDRNTTIVRQCIIEQAEWPTEAWLRAWILVEALPLSDGWVSIATDVVDHLVHTRPEDWNAQASACWCSLISKIDNHASAHLKLCVRALEFCIDHQRLPVAPVAAVAFFPVHQAALQERTSTAWNVFGFLHWDRGLELRRRLVDSFCQGCWPPEWFVIAAHEPWLLRKMCKRMMRKWKGDEFLQRAYDALQSEGFPQHRALLEALRNIIEFPNYSEDWD